MSERQRKPKATLITEEVVRCVAEVRVENGYSITLAKVERLNADNHEFNNPEHLKAIVDPGDPERQPNPSEGEDQWQRVVWVHVWLMPSQQDPEPIDELADKVYADLTLAVCDDATERNRRGGLAIDTTPGDPILVGPHQDSLAYTLNVPFLVEYSTRTRNLYE